MCCLMHPTDYYDAYNDPVKSTKSAAAAQKGATGSSGDGDGSGSSTTQPKTKTATPATSKGGLAAAGQFQIPTDQTSGSPRKLHTADQLTAGSGRKLHNSRRNMLDKKFKAVKLPAAAATSDPDAAAPQVVQSADQTQSATVQLQPATASDTGTAAVVSHTPSTDVQAAMPQVQSASRQDDATADTVSTVASQTPATADEVPTLLDPQPLATADPTSSSTTQLRDGNPVLPSSADSAGAADGSTDPHLYNPKILGSTQGVTPNPTDPKNLNVIYRTADQIRSTFDQLPGGKLMKAAEEAAINVTSSGLAHAVNSSLVTFKKANNFTGNAVHLVTQVRCRNFM